MLELLFATKKPQNLSPIDISVGPVSFCGAHLIVDRVREVELDGDGVPLAEHELVFGGVQLQGEVGITAGAGLVRTGNELEVNVFFMNLNKMSVTIYQMLIQNDIT